MLSRYWKLILARAWRCPPPVPGGVENARGRTGEGRFRGIWRAVLIAAAMELTLALGLAAPAETRAFKVLVAPGRGVASGAFSHASDLVAALNKQPYTIRSAEPLQPGEGRTVIVLDLGATPPTSRACLMAEALAAMERIHESPPPVLVARGASSLTSRVNLGPGRDFDVYAGEDLQGLTRECDSGQSPDPRYNTLSSFGMVTKVFDSLSTIILFTHLRNSFAALDAPVRVFWLAGNFSTFVFWKSGMEPPLHGIERVAEADLTFFPIVIGGRHGGRWRSPLRLHVQEAEVLAQTTGGFVSIASGRPGDTLVRAFEQSRQGVVLTLEGPVTADGRRPASARTLKIQASGGDQPVRWQRRFVVNREGSVKAPAPESELVPMIVPSINLGLRYGCQESGATAGEQSLELKLPPEVVNEPSGQVDVYLDYPEEKGLAKQRATLARTQDVAGGLCLPLMHARDGMKFRVVVVDRASGKVGAAAGVLSSNNGGR